MRYHMFMNIFLNSGYRWAGGIHGAKKIGELHKKWKSLRLQDHSIDMLSEIEELLQCYSSESSTKLVITNKSKLKWMKESFGSGDDALSKIGVSNNFFSIDEDVEDKKFDVNQYISSSLELLFRNVTWMKDISDIIVRAVVPIKIINHSDKYHKAGFSSLEVKGLIFYSFNNKNINRIEMAVDYAHELGHQALFVYQAADLIIRNGEKHKIYSSIKKADRPAIMTFHSLAALSYMKVAVEELASDKSLCCEEIEYSLMLNKSISRMLLETIQNIEKSEVQFTGLGQMLFEEFSSTYYYKKGKI